MSPVQIWDEIMKRHKVAQVCEQELFRMQSSDKPEAKADLKHRHAIAVAAAVEALSKLHSKEVQQVMFF